MQEKQDLLKRRMQAAVSALRRRASEEPTTLSERERVRVCRELAEDLLDEAVARATAAGELSGSDIREVRREVEAVLAPAFESEFGIGSWVDSVH